MRKGIRYAIDFGDARVGLAKSDIDAIMAVPVATIKNDQNMLKNINYWRNAPIWNPKSINDATKEWFDFLGNKYV